MNNLPELQNGENYIFLLRLIVTTLGEIRFEGIRCQNL
jgi:hypothetical protein